MAVLPGTPSDAFITTSYLDKNSVKRVGKGFLAIGLKVAFATLTNC